MLNVSLFACFLLVLAACAGPQGSQGPSGPSAASPPSCTLLVKGDITEIVCPDGSHISIKNGTNGRDGQDGKDGTDGNDGHDATPVTVVQLCEGTPSYPNVFIEIGLCIDGKLYGVYSANGGFATYLPPGAYTSNGVGSACNFTVGDDCAVSH